jgi:hypothetical protein
MFKVQSLLESVFPRAFDEKNMPCWLNNAGALPAVDAFVDFKSSKLVRHNGLKQT